MSRQVPRAASSIILLRAAGPQGFEVLLVHQKEPRTTADGPYGFPTDVVAQADFKRGMAQRCRGLAAKEAQKIVGADLSPAHALGFWVAASRLLFEKVGILLAVDANGQRLETNNPAYVSCLAKREPLLEKKITFQALLEEENLYADVARQAHFSHWQWSEPGCPSLDIRFFLTRPPQGDPFVVAGHEPQGALWITPDRAMNLCYKNKLWLPFPIFASLRSLADFDSIQAVSTAYQLA